MKNNITNFGYFVVIVILGTGFSFADETQLNIAERKSIQNKKEPLTDEERNEIRKTTSQKWQKELGCVDFTKKPLFNCMTYLHPKPESSILPFKGVTLSPKIKQDHSFWLGMFFKDKLLDQLQKLSPTGYYINDGKQESVRGNSFLVFETIYERNKITLIENGRIIFMTIEPNQYIPAVGVTKEFVETLLVNNLNLDKEKGQSVLKEFSFPDRMIEGYTFLSINTGDFLRYRDWRDNIVGFVGKKGIHIMFFKTNPRNPRLGVQLDNGWLNKGLLKEDGKPL